MNVVVFCDIPCERLTPLQAVRTAELPLCGRPLLAYQLAVIAQSGAADRLWLVDASDALRKTAGQIRTMTLMDGAPPRTAASDTLIISASGLLDCDFAAALEQHRKSEAAVTFLTMELPPESRSARLRTDGTHICGKGKRNDPLADTGYAIVRQGVSITPRLTALCDGNDTAYFALASLWEPLCSVESYLRCQKLVLGGWPESGAHKRLDGLITPTADSFPQAELEPPVYLGHRVKIGADTKIAQSVIGNGVNIGSGVSLDGCVVLDGAYIGDGVQARDALICADAMLMNACRLEPESAVGEGAVVGEHAVVESQVRVFAGKRVAPRTTAELDIRGGLQQALYLEEERVSGDLTPTEAIRLGNCLAQTGDSVTIGYASGQAAQTLAFAVCAGCTAAGARVILTPDAALPAVCYASAQAKTELLLYIEAGAEVTLRLLSQGGLPLTEAQEDALTNALDCRTLVQIPHSAFGEIIQLDSAQALYEHALRRRFAALRRTDVSVSTSDARLRRLGAQLFGDGAEQSGLILQLSADGRQLSVYSDQTGFVRSERVLLLCSLILLEQEGCAALLADAPQAAEQIAQETGGKILRCLADGSGTDARETALRQRFAIDGLYAAGVVLEYLAVHRLTLAAALEKIPKIHVARRILSADALPRRILHSLRGTGRLSRTDERGVLSFCPSYSGKMVTAYAEAASMEAAEELFADAERLFGE